ncbi:hypothetical protein P154DRAFT_558631 [Amniculicola lignicola CBS 123094]|uniref:Uncharacterized protein n=1 Tax=Amniculicola lignicola CBS 123094 TaxID=1392246 RepID=A0A6A5X370_9PLEO|nr:hypothetical protein P154DRAFT_558631 [Amniculicola lignicola CBS 123094]
MATTTLLAQPGLAAPSNRQDVISALLNDYSTSFGQTSPYSYPPVPALKDLPPPPPSKDEKPLPPVLGSPFPLRVEDAPSPDRNDSPHQSPNKIIFRAMSRSSKPPSLKLVRSNGSTATLDYSPPAPAPVPSHDPFADPSPAARVPSTERISTERPLPPPPPEKSARRQQSNASMGHRGSKEAGEGQEERGRSPEVKRKALPTQAVKKFMSLAELRGGPRANRRPSSGDEAVPRKPVGGDRPVLPPPVSEREASISPERTSKQSTLSSAPAPAPAPAPQLPPKPAALPAIPQNLKAERPAPAPPKKNGFMGGLPTNPKHSRGKSSTGFDMLKGPKPISKPIEQQSTPISSMTPGPTPPPEGEKGQPPLQLGSLIQSNLRVPDSPVSPISPLEESTTGSRRPFSYEAPAPKQQPKPQPQPQPQPRAPSAPIPYPKNDTNPTQANLRISAQSAPERSSSPSPFPPPRITSPTGPPSITAQHLGCYTRHKTFLGSLNNVHRVPCQICAVNTNERQWACGWCYLRICGRCRDELVRAPGRDLRVVLERRGAGRREEGGMPVVLVSGAEGEDYS